MLYPKIKELPALKIRITAFIISCCLVLSSSIICRAEDKPSVAAQSAALLCVDTGEFLYLKSSKEKLPMASTTKIMTSIIALEEAARSDKIVTFTRDMIAEGSSMGLKLGYKLRLSDLAAGMMTVSGNDAANAAAIAISGSFEKFANRMNAKARELGMENTSFVTPSGLDDENHYSTAEDMARLMEYAMRNTAFAELVREKSVRVDYVYPEELSIAYSSHNKLLSMYEYCTGGKTGYTKRAGRCLVTAAERDGKHLIAVTINSGDDWNDHIKLFDYGFSCLTSAELDDAGYSESVAVVGGEKDEIAVSSVSGSKCVVRVEDEGRISRAVRLPQFVYAPIKRGEKVGEIEYILDEKVIATSELRAEEDCALAVKDKGFFELIGDILKRIFWF